MRRGWSSVQSSSAWRVKGRKVPQIAQALELDEKTVRKWLKRFGEQGVEGLEDAPRSGAPSQYSVEVKTRIFEIL